jgi:DMSO/TMAO reductase YedYZ molybdopterin-dependent catalytic subunit
VEKKFPEETGARKMIQFCRFLSMACVVILLAGCAAGVPTSTPNALTPVEIQSFNGQKLTAADSLPDNSIAGPQQINLDLYRLNVTGLVDHPLSYTYAHVLEGQAYTKVVTLHCVEGWDATILWEGVLIDDLLTAAAAQPAANTVIFHAVDGYTSSLSLDFIRKNKILLAYKMNGLPLLPERGFPFQVVAEDKWGYKWVKWVKEIEVSSDTEYQGYWEQRGYNKNGDHSGSMFAQ